MMNRKITTALGLAGLVSLSACLDLEENVVSGVTASYYETVAGFEDAVEAAYAGLRDQYAQEMSMTMQEMGTDLWTKGADGSHKYWNDYDAQLNPTASYVRNYWNDTYRAINTANAAIARSENLEELDEAKKTARIAEVRFLRALYYFNLVRTYGDVHVSLEETTGVVTESARTPEAEVYSSVIIPDLEFAMNNLPPVQDDYGRATKGAAQHLLGLVHLTRAYESFGEAGDAQKAADLFKTVIESGEYDLLPEFDDVYELGNERNKEVIFSAQFTNDPLTAGPGNRWHLYFLMEYDREPGMQRVLHYGRPWKRLRPTEKLLYLWDREIDTRYEDSFQHVWYAVKDDPAAGLEVGDTAIFLPAVKTSELPEKYHGKPYKILTEPDDFWSPTPTEFGNEYDYRYFPALSKHLDPTRLSINDVRGQRDFFVMRLADTYLLAAEALLKAGKPAEAVPYINAVRRRAAKPGHEAEMEITAADVTLDFILDERGRELAGEGHRWYTLARTGKLVSLVRDANLDAAANIQDYHILRPIPQDQIDRTTSDFPQNPGY